MTEQKSSETNKYTNSRVVSLDIIRTVAIFLVLVCHCDSSFLPTEISNALKAAATLGVPLFVLLTGYLMLDRDYDGPYLVKYLKRNLLPLVVSFELWNILYWALGKVISGNPDAINFSQMVKIAFFMDDTGSSMWYMPMIIGLYLGIPIISMILKHVAATRQRVYAVILLLLLIYFGTAIPTLQQLNNSFNLDINIHNVLQMNIFGASVWGGAVWTLLLVIGYLIKKTSCLSSNDNHHSRAMFVAYSTILPCWKSDSEQYILHGIRKHIYGSCFRFTVYDNNPLHQLNPALFESYSPVLY